MVENGNFSEEQLRKIAKRKINYRQTVKIHFAAFILVNLLLFTINIIFTPSYLWVLYPFFGWFIGLALHSVSYLVYAKGVYPYAKRGVIFHASAYLTVMLLLILIDVQIMAWAVGPITWSLYPLFFWGLGLVAHIAVYLIYLRGGISDGEAKSKRERSIEKEIQKLKK